MKVLFTEFLQVPLPNSFEIPVLDSINTFPLMILTYRTPSSQSTNQFP